MTEKYKLQQEDINSMDLNGDTLAKLKQILPEVFAEGADGKPSIDIERLKIALGAAVDVESDNKSRFSFGWSGKKQAQALANQPSTATLRPSIDDSKNWDTTQNVYIEGDNLEVLKLLQKSYYGQIKMIYIDPPYNTGKDFVYKDNFHDNVKNYLQLTGQVDDEGNKISTNTDKSGRYHTDWLNMMYPRLKLARNLLKDDGVIFISIDDNEVHNLRKICDEIFGEDNFRNIFIARRYDKNLNRQFLDSGLQSFNTGFEYIVCYSKGINFNFEPIFKQSSNDRRELIGYWKGFWNDADRKTMRYDILGFKPEVGQWKWKEERALIAINNYQFYLEYHSVHKTLEEYWLETGCKLEFIRRNTNGSGKNKGVENWIAPTDKILRNTNWTDVFASKKEPLINELFDYPKNVDLIKLAVSSGLLSNSNDIILDFFSGSATTAHAVMQLNAEDGGKRKYICVQLPEATSPESEAYKAGYKNICEIGKERIRRAGEKVFAEWTEKQQKSAQASANAGLFADDAENNTAQTSLDIGFKVFKLDTSNLKPFDASDMFADDLLVANRSALDLFYELVLKQGYSLDNCQCLLDIGGTRCYALVHEDNTPFVLAVLDDTVKSNFALELLKYALTLVIVKDDCFGTDEIKLNLLATLEQLQSKDNPLQIRII